MIAALIDQYPGLDGTTGTFLGKSAKTVRAIAGLQERTGVPAVSVYALLRDDDVYDVVIETVPTPEHDADATRDERIEAVQRAHNDVVERWVRSHPEHWFGWFHRRFRPYLDYSRTSPSEHPEHERIE